MSLDVGGGSQLSGASSGSGLEKARAAQKRLLFVPELDYAQDVGNESDALK